MAKVSKFEIDLNQTIHYSQDETTNSAFDGPISHEPPTLVPDPVAPKNYCKRF